MKKCSTIAPTAIIYDNVTIGEGSTVEDYCILGAPPAGKKSGELPTLIGPNSHIRSGTIIYSGNNIGSHFQTGNKANVRESNKIGDYVSIGTLTVVEHQTRIGNRVRIHSQAFIPEFTVIEDDVWIGPQVVLTNAKYPASKGAKQRLQGPVIERFAKIGANSTVLPGIRIGEQCLVGAGSVVTKNVETRNIVIGNPAIVKGSVQSISHYNGEIVDTSS